MFSLFFESDPSLGRNHIVEDRPTPFYIQKYDFLDPQLELKITIFVPLLVPTTPLFVRFHVFLSLALLKIQLWPVQYAFFASLQTSTTLPSPTCKRSTCTSSLNLRIAPTVRPFSSAPPPPNTFYYSFASFCLLVNLVYINTDEVRNFWRKGGIRRSEVRC